MTELGTLIRTFHYKYNSITLVWWFIIMGRAWASRTLTY